MEETTKKTKNGRNVYVTELRGEGEEGQYHVVVGHNGEQLGTHTGDAATSAKFIADKTKPKDGK